MRASIILPAALLAATAAHAQTDIWNLTGTATGTIAVVTQDQASVTVTPASMGFAASFTVTNGTMTAWSVDGMSGTGSAGVFAGGEISPLLNAQGQVYGGEVSYSMNAPTGGGVGFDINNGSINYFSVFGQSDGTTTYTSLTGGGAWVDPPVTAGRK